MVAYQGVPGAYSEQAALKACPEWSHIPCESFELVFQALSQVGALSRRSRARGELGFRASPAFVVYGFGLAPRQNR